MLQIMLNWWDFDAKSFLEVFCWFMLAWRALKFPASFRAVTTRWVMHRRQWRGPCDVQFSCYVPRTEDRIHLKKLEATSNTSTCAWIRCQWGGLLLLRGQVEHFQEDFWHWSRLTCWPTVPILWQGSDEVGDTQPAWHCFKGEVELLKEMKDLAVVNLPQVPDVPSS